MQSPLVNIRGRWLELDPVQMVAARTFLQGNQAEGQSSNRLNLPLMAKG